MEELEVYDLNVYDYELEVIELELDPFDEVDGSDEWSEWRDIEVQVEELGVQDWPTVLDRQCSTEDYKDKFGDYRDLFYPFFYDTAPSVFLPFLPFLPFLLLALASIGILISLIYLFTPKKGRSEKGRGVRELTLNEV